MPSTYEFTYVTPQDRCRQTAMFLWWLNRGISIVLIIFVYYIICPVMLFSVHQSLQDRLRVATGKKKKSAVTGKADSHGPQTSTGDTRDSLAETGTIGDNENSATEARKAKSDSNSSDADTVIVDTPSSDTHTINKMPALSAEKATLDHVAENAPPKRAMTPEQIRQISHIFVQHTLLTFVVHPFLVFLGCLVNNNVTFCDGRNRHMPLSRGLWWMLWALLPGYLSWGWSVVASWGETATVVMGWDEGRKEGEISSLQMVLMCVTMPVPMLLMVLGSVVYNGLVSLVELVMKRRTQSGIAHENLRGDMNKAGYGSNEQRKKDL